MSGLYENKKTIRSLRTMIADLKPKNNEKYFFVFGYPRSDIGKGTLVAQLLVALPNSDAIKFDGLLNTNENGRHTAVGHDDFGVYEKFNPQRRWGREHYLLGGELYRDFINMFGENENLQINPHLSLFVEYCIHKMWNDIGKPEVLFIEVGGLITDPEVDPIFTPMLQRLTEEGFAQTILLSEIAYNGEYIKTKTIQNAIGKLAERQIRPWLLVARDAADMKEISLSERLEFERVIMNKICSAFNFNLSRIISVPYFQKIEDYTDYMVKRFQPLVSPNDKNNIIIATSNSSKFADFKLYLGEDYNLQQSSKLDIKLSIPEGIDSIEDNAVAKARAWAIVTGKIAIGDDTGFFIRELNGEPGVALRRWGGELKAETTNEEFWKYLQEKTKDLKNYDCYFEQCIAIVSPNGEVRIIYNKNEGYLNKEKLTKPYNGSGYPIGAAFESCNRNKTWDEMTDDEKKSFDKDLINNLKRAIDSI